MSDDRIDAALRAHADLGLDPAGDRPIADAVLLRRRAPGAAVRRSRLPRLLTPVAAGFAALALTAVAAAAIGVWNPSLGDDRRGHPTSGTSDVPAEQLERFGVLRRPANATDRDARTAAALRYLNGRFEGVRVDRIRAVQPAPGGRRYLVVPVERSDSGVADALCLYAVDREGGGIGCWSTAQVLDGRAQLVALRGAPETGPAGGDPAGLRPDATRATVIGLVPDGVATVLTADGRRAGVHDNVFALSTARPDGAATTWLDAKGNVVPRR